MIIYCVDCLATTKQSTKRLLIKGSIYNITMMT